MSSKLAKIAEVSEETRNYIINRNIDINSGHGLLPSNCCKCKGPLDFVRVVNGEKGKTVLECRECKHQIALD